MDKEELRARFQQAFEARFKPLERRYFPQESKTQESDNSEEDYDDRSDWGGLEDDDAVVQVIDHGDEHQFKSIDQNLEKKAFMSSRPPNMDVAIKNTSNSKIQEDNEEDACEATNRKHDLALQQLLKESHLLDQSAFKGSSHQLEGKGRLKALDRRFQDLGAKTSLFEQKNMPISHRKGIKAKATSREVARRREALENGIVLERAKTTAKLPKRRERGIAAPSVGKFRGGTLQISSQDVRSVKGNKDRRHAKGRK